MHRISAIGEILWDIFPDGPRFGGAPANFCCAAGELAPEAAEVSMISAVGQDELGSQALAALTARSVRTTAVQVNQQPTGSVLVEVDGAGVATYRFAEDTAWDRITWGDTLAANAADCDAVCFGTLGQRAELSRETIRQFVSSTAKSVLRILDINLRPPYSSDEVILESLKLANILKLNDDELSYVAGLLQIEGELHSLLQQISRRCNLRLIAVTRGADGAVIWTESAISDLPGMSVEVADTVGAGDAFTASMTLGLLNQDPIQKINARAIETASYVCSQPGATMSMPSHLQF